MKFIFIISDETAMGAKVGDWGHSTTLVGKVAKPRWGYFQSVYGTTSTHLEELGQQIKKKKTWMR